MEISIIGSGNVGTAVGKGLSKHGHTVTFCDLDPKRVDVLKKEGLDATEDTVVKEITFITVPTPAKSNGEIALKYVREAIENIAMKLRERESKDLIVMKSTVFPPYIKKELLPLLEKTAEGQAGKEFGFCYNPEFTKERHPLRDFLHPHAIVIGEYDKESGRRLEKLYDGFNAPVYRTDIKTAAMVKYASNIFRATKISFFNELYLVCQFLDIDSDLVSEIISKEKGIGNYGIWGGKPFKGDCLPKDLSAALYYIEQETPLEAKLLKAAKAVNEKMKRSSLRRDKEIKERIS